MQNAFHLLQERGFIYQTTHEEELVEHLKKPRIFYIGFDPTADSLHVGSLVPIMAMVQLQKLGHFPIAIIGGGTARVGDPSGKTEMRQMLQEEALLKNEEGLKKQLSHYLEFSSDKGKVLNNKDWLLKLGYIDFLRDIGVHFSVNRMLTAESVKQRLEKGLSFIEFNYSLLQAYDFYVLLRDHKCTVQMGGQDQWGNIVAGDDLCRRMGLKEETFGITFPLLTNSSGAKFGKSEKGNIWLDASRTSPFEYYQFWRNCEDADVNKFLKIFTFLPVAEVYHLCSENINRAKEVLAFEATALTHGKEEAAKAYATAGSKFGFADKENKIQTSSNIKSVNISSSIDMPQLSISSSEMAEMSWVSLLVRAELASSKSEARRLIKGKGGKYNDSTIENGDEIIPKSIYDSGSFVLRAGKKRFKQIIIQ